MTAITEQTRSVSKASRGLNSIMAALAQVLDENSSNGKKITKIYDDLGVSMFDTNGQLKSGFDLLQGLAGKWNTLDSNTQKYIATTIAGKQNCPFKVNCWEVLKLRKLQHEDEICLSVND